jgi:class 3 adenylate cyclase
MERRLAAILAADVVGYSRLMGEDEEGTLATLRRTRELLDGLIGDFDGRVFGGAGDSVMAEFPSPVQAVRFAIRFQGEIDEHNAGLPEPRRMRFRIGINLGDVMVEDDNLFGDGVNIAARIQALADPGGVCVADSVYQQIRNKVPLESRYLGKQTVKNIARPVVVHKILTKTARRPGPFAVLADLVRRHRGVAAAVIVAAAAGAGFAAWLALPPATRTPEGPGAFPEIVRPSRHFKVDRPAELADADALVIYDRILEDMVAAYETSGHPHAAAYSTWRRYNTAPYLSATHGNRYVNNYANDIAEAYGKAEAAGRLPQGSVLAKDGFEVTDRGDVLSGSLALMEKMAPGFNPEGRDWRYTMILPDGTLFGTTRGENAERVEFCMDCHIAAGEDQDHLFFVPEAYRTPFLDLGASTD